MEMNSIFNLSNRFANDLLLLNSIQRKTTTRDFFNFRFSLVDRTEEEKKSILKRFVFKFETPRGIVYVPQQYIEFIQEEHLYREDENEKCQEIRYGLWGTHNGDKISRQFYQYTLHNDADFNRIRKEIDSIDKPVPIYSRPSIKARILEEFNLTKSLLFDSTPFPECYPHLCLIKYSQTKLKKMKKNFLKELFFCIAILRFTYMMTRISLRQKFNFKKDN
jgi:hypothetical protein